MIAAFDYCRDNPDTPSRRNGWQLAVDHFLLSFRYAAENGPERDRHVPINFGSTGQPINQHHTHQLRNS